MFINGVPLKSVKDWFVLNAGYVRQLAVSFYSELTVRQNLLLSMTMQSQKGQSTYQILERVEQVIQEVTASSLTFLLPTPPLICFALPLSPSLSLSLSLPPSLSLSLSLPLSLSLSLFLFLSPSLSFSLSLTHAHLYINCSFIYRLVCKKQQILKLEVRVVLVSVVGR